MEVSLRYQRETVKVMTEFLDQISDFIFVEDEPKKADVILCRKRISADGRAGG